MPPFQPRFGELFLNISPTFRIFGVSFRQGPDGVKVIGQHHDGIDCERKFIHTLTYALPQECTSGFKQNGLAPLDDNREEEGATWE